MTFESLSFYNKKSLSIALAIALSALACDAQVMEPDGPAATEKERSAAADSNSKGADKNAKGAGKNVKGSFQVIDLGNGKGELAADLPRAADDDGYFLRVMQAEFHCSGDAKPLEHMRVEESTCRRSLRVASPLPPGLEKVNWRYRIIRIQRNKLVAGGLYSELWDKYTTAKETDGVWRFLLRPVGENTTVDIVDWLSSKGMNPIVEMDFRGTVRPESREKKGASDE